MIQQRLPSRKPTYPTWGKGKSSSNMPYQGDLLIPWRLNISLKLWIWIVNVQLFKTLMYCNCHASMIIISKVSGDLGYQRIVLVLKDGDKWQVPLCGGTSCYQVIYEFGRVRSKRSTFKQQGPLRLFLFQNSPVSISYDLTLVVSCGLTKLLTKHGQKPWISVGTGPIHEVSITQWHFGGISRIHVKARIDMPEFFFMVRELNWHVTM